MSDAANVVRVVSAVGDAIRELGKVPSGYLYAQVCGVMSLGVYERCIDMLKRAKLVEQNGMMLRWIGPAKGEQP